MFYSIQKTNNNVEAEDGEIFADVNVNGYNVFFFLLLILLK